MEARWTSCPGGSPDATSLSGTLDDYGTASGTGIASGGIEYAFSGAQDLGATIFTGGAQYVESGGVASHAVVSNGATQIVSSGAAAAGTVISGANTQQVTAVVSPPCQHTAAVRVHAPDHGRGRQGRHAANSELWPASGAGNGAATHADSPVEREVRP